MSIGDLPGVLRAHRRLVAVVAATVLVISSVAALLAPVSFASTSVVEVRPRDPSIDLRSAYYGGRVVAGQATPYVELFQNGAVLAGVLRRLGPAAPTDEVAARAMSATTVIETDRITVAIDVDSDRSARTARVAEAAAFSFAALVQRGDPRGSDDVVDVVARAVGTPSVRPVTTGAVVVMLIGSVSAVALAVVAALLARRRGHCVPLSSKEERQ